MLLIIGEYGSHDSHRILSFLHFYFHECPARRTTYTQQRNTNSEHICTISIAGPKAHSSFVSNPRKYRTILCITMAWVCIQGKRVPYQFEIYSKKLWIEKRDKRQVSIRIERKLNEIMSCDRIQSVFILNKNVVKMCFHVPLDRHDPSFCRAFAQQTKGQRNIQ